MSERARKTEGCDPTQHLWTRRGFVGAAGWTAVLGSLGVATAAFGRFMFPRVLFEPEPLIKLGRPSEYKVNQVSERWLKEHRLWVVRLDEGLIALSAKCTHLGCTPRWLDAEGRFKCPCHGSGFYGPEPGKGDHCGENYEGPAPRPLERFKIALAEDGQVVVDTSVVFRAELPDPTRNWLAPDALLRV